MAILSLCAPGPCYSATTEETRAESWLCSRDGIYAETVLTTPWALMSGLRRASTGKVRSGQHTRPTAQACSSAIGALAQVLGLKALDPEPRQTQTSGEAELCRWGTNCGLLATYSRLRTGRAWTLGIVKALDGQKGFQVLPWRWIVERTFTRLCKFRRFRKNYEFLTDTGESMISAAMTRFTVARLAKIP